MRRARRGCVLRVETVSSSTREGRAVGSQGRVAGQRRSVDPPEGKNSGKSPVRWFMFTTETLGLYHFLSLHLV